MSRQLLVMVCVILAGFAVLCLVIAVVVLATIKVAV